MNEIEQKKNDILSNKLAYCDSIGDHQGISRDYFGSKLIVNESRMNAQAVPFEPSAGNTVPTIGQDLSVETGSNTYFYRR